MGYTPRLVFKNYLHLGKLYYQAHFKEQTQQQEAVP